MKFFLTALFSVFSIWAFAQTDSAGENQLYKPQPVVKKRFVDSTALARWRFKSDSVQSVKDSIKHIGDSLSLVWIKPPNPRRKNQFVDSLVNVYTVRNLNFGAWSKRFIPKVNHINEGKSLPKGETWLLGFVVLLLLFFAVLKNAFSKDLTIIIQGLWNNRILSQITKDDNIFSSWPFVFLYILFGFTIGTFLYLCGRFFQLTYLFEGFQWLLALSIAIIALFTLKIVLLRLLGFIFSFQKLVNEYVSVLYLSYFNTAILYLPLIFAFCLTPGKYAEVYIYVAFFVFIVTFLFQFIRIAANIISSYRFSKVYLIIYLCALEICPLLILVKALRF
ncbi:DUF4271 domain-containing protein [Pedobacter sp. HMF7647]|uniref:DUF4271 domain-containing protein n=1 Tax=Hufsiella arboris TaxID=2695275 RepID=A0A7K1Y4M6_9SPHI|nr:DUF4271 domain-containing protein [Hufsiella arboris]MXV49370.1 DUF4271 domain-containing protein [Hufsiella arboris]